MTLEAAFANAEDLERIERLTILGHFAPWFPAYSRHAALACLTRVWLLKIMFRAIPYPSPTVTTE